jgi:outer membrane protein OmpA-like peptidoglycan-associated protein
MNRCSTLILLVLSLCLQPVHANVVGADTQNFNPTNDGLDFVTVHSSETLEPGLLNLGFFLNYAVNSLPNYTDTSTQTRTNFRDSLLSADMNFAVGLMRDWEAGFSFPFLLGQTVDSDLNTFRGEFAQNGLTEVRLMTKYRLLGDSAGGVAGVFSMNFNQIEDNPFLGDGAGPTYNLELAADTTMGLFGVGANVGYRVRNPGRQLSGVPVVPFDDQYIGSLAINYLTPWQVKVIGEIFGSWPVEESRFTSDRDDSSLEALLGVKADITQSVAFHFGAGTEIFQGTSSPDWRVYTGINWVLGPLFSENREVFVKVKGGRIRSLEDLNTDDPFAGAPDVDEAFLARDVLFEFNSDRLQPEAIESLKRLVQYLSRPPGLTTLIVEGHTDSVGSAIYNENLSQRRADSVRKALISVGLSASKVKAIGYGESRPIADNGNFQGRAMNRRVEFKVKR